MIYLFQRRRFAPHDGDGVEFRCYLHPRRRLLTDAYSVRSLVLDRALVLQGYFD